MYFNPFLTAHVTVIYQMEQNIFIHKSTNPILWSTLISLKWHILSFNLHDVLAHLIEMISTDEKHCTDLIWRKVSFFCFEYFKINTSKSNYVWVYVGSFSWWFGGYEGFLVFTENFMKYEWKVLSKIRQIWCFCDC